MRSVLRRRNRFISARSLFARKYFLPGTPTSPNRNAISRSFIIRGAITSGLQNFIALHSKLGRKRRPSRQRNTKSWRRTTPIFSVHSVRPVKRTRSKTGPARNDAVDCGCAGCADKSASLRQFFRAHVAELADAYGSGPYGATRGGSSPLVSIADPRPDMQQRRCDQSPIVSHPGASTESGAGCDTRVRRTLIFNRIVN